MVHDLQLCQVELHFSSCVYVYSQEKMCHVISLSIPCRKKLSCAKIYVFKPARKYKAESVLVIKIEIYIG